MNAALGNVGKTVRVLEGVEPDKPTRSKNSQTI